MICKLKLISALPYNCAHGPIKYTTVHLFLFSNFIWEKSPPYIPDGDDLYNIFHLLYFFACKAVTLGLFPRHSISFHSHFLHLVFSLNGCKKGFALLWVWDTCTYHVLFVVKLENEIAIDEGGKIHWLENVYQKHKSRWFTRLILLGKR